MMVIRCSKLARPMTCAGSLYMNVPEQETNEAAKEGTAAGELLRHMLEGTPIPAMASNGVYFNDDMHFHVTPIAKDILRRANGGKILCEQPIDWMTRSGIMIKGQYDQSYIENDALVIDDLKYGWGLHEVYGHWQLLGYGIGEVIRRNQVFEKIILRIRQPRPHHEDGDTRDWVLTFAELLEWKEKIEKRMDTIFLGDKTLVTSKQCAYCPAAAEACPAMNKALYRGVEVIHQFTQDQITNQELSFQLDLISRVTEVMKIKSSSLEALANDRIKRGEVIPNYVSQQKYGDRKWQGFITPDVIKTLTGISVVKSEMLSPAQAEKVGVPKDVVNGLVDRFFVGNKLVRKDANAVATKIFGAKP